MLYFITRVRVIGFVIVSRNVRQCQCCFMQLGVLVEPDNQAAIIRVTLRVLCEVDDVNR